MFFKRVTATPSECLIVMQGGRAINKGNGASAKLWAWDSYALVPTNAIEHTFQMHQETSDGISLRFKGIVIYRIIDPVLAATLFSFQTPDDVRSLSQAIGDVCLGELRAIVAGMSMDECIQKRKTVLTGHLNDSVIPSIEGRDEAPGWGVKVDVLQVAQVFCPDAGLLAQIQAEARDKLKKTAQFSSIETTRALDLARLESDREVGVRNLAMEKDRLDERKTLEEKRIATESALKVAALESRQVEEEKRIATESALRVAELRNQQVHEQKRIETEGALTLAELESRQVHEQKRIEIEADLRRLELQRRMEIAEQELRLAEIEARIHEVRTRSEALAERARMEIRKEILPLEQLPQVSQSLAGLYRDARLTVYGDAGHAGFMGVASDLVDVVMDRIKEAYPRPSASQEG